MAVKFVIRMLNVEVGSDPAMCSLPAAKSGARPPRCRADPVWALWRDYCESWRRAGPWQSWRLIRTCWRPARNSRPRTSAI